jgi:hypothetical protein
VLDLSRCGLRAGLVAVAVLCAPAAVDAQELSVYHSVARSDIPEIAEAGGFGVTLGFRTGRVQLRPGVLHHNQTTTVNSRVCLNYELRVGCQDEDVERSARLSGLQLVAAVPMQPVPMLGFEVAGGITLSQLTASDRTASRRASNLFANPSGQWGVMLLAGAQLRPLPAVPLTVKAAVGNHRMRLTSCGEYAWDYSPFCGTTDIREVRVGLGYMWR